MNLQITLLLKLGAAPSSGGATVAIYNDATQTPNALIATVGRILDSDLTTTPTNVTLSWNGTLAPNTRYWIGLLRDTGSNIIWAISSTPTGVGVSGEYTYDSRSGSIQNGVGLPYMMQLADGVGIFSSVSARLLGVAGTGFAGSLINHVLPSNAASFVIGSMHSEVDESLTGVSGTGAAGTITVDQLLTAPLIGVDLVMSVSSLGEEIDEFLEGAGFEGLVGTAGVISDGDHTNVEMPGILGIFQAGDLAAGITDSRSLQGVDIHSAAGNIIAHVLETLVGNAIGSAAGSIGKVISAEGLIMDDLLVETKPAQPSDFNVSLLYSDDKGATWSFPIETTIGSLGDYVSNLQWQRLGMARDRVFAIQWSSPCKTSLIGVFVDTTVGKT